MKITEYLTEPEAWYLRGILYLAEDRVTYEVGQQMDMALLARMKCPIIEAKSPIPQDALNNILLSLKHAHMPTVPHDFKPEFSTSVDSGTGNEIRMAVAYGSPNYPGDTGQRWALGYVLSMPDWQEGVLRRIHADEVTRAYLWLLMRAADVVEANKLCEGWLAQVYKKDLS